MLFAWTDGRSWWGAVTNHIHNAPTIQYHTVPARACIHLGMHVICDRACMGLQPHSSSEKVPPSHFHLPPPPRWSVHCIVHEEAHANNGMRGLHVPCQLTTRPLERESFVQRACAHTLYDCITLWDWGDFHPWGISTHTGQLSSTAWWCTIQKNTVFCWPGGHGVCAHCVASMRPCFVSWE